MDAETAIAILRQRIGERRRELDLSVEEFAEHAAVHPNTIRNVEGASEYVPRLAQLLRIAATCGRSLSWMVGEELPDYPVEAEPLIRLSPQLTRSNIDALCVMAKELITSEAETAARRPLTRAAEDESEYRASPPADEDAASQGTDTGS